jgi:uncharacterized protein (TIGR03437 family)
MDFPVTANALQSTWQAPRFQGFAVKVDPNGDVVYSTFIGGNSDIYPGVYLHPGLNSILVDSEGDAILTGQTESASANSTPFPQTPGAPFTNSDLDTYFTMKLDPAGQRMLFAIRGIGGMIATDAQGNFYVAGIAGDSTTSPLPVTAGAFENSIDPQPCNSLGPFFGCGYQYVAKLNSTLSQIEYATWLTGTYGASPVAIAVDAQGNVWVAGNTNSEDYPTTPNAFEPKYAAGGPAPTQNPCLLNCVTIPQSSGYLTKLNASGTGLIYSTYFSGSQTDGISFAAFTGNAIYLAGVVGSPDLPGLGSEYCLPVLPAAAAQLPFAATLSADGTQVAGSAVVGESVLAFDGANGKLIGVDLSALAPPAGAGLIGCILDSADLAPVTSISPGELLSLFGADLASSVTIPGAGQAPSLLGGASVLVNGVVTPLLYVGPQQVNFQAPFALGNAAQATIELTSGSVNSSGQTTLPIVASDPVAFMDKSSAAYLNCGAGSIPLAFNEDGSRNSCTNAAPAGSVVTMFVGGLGAAAAIPVVTASGGGTVVSVSALPAVVSGIWQVGVQMPLGASGAIELNLSAGGMAVRDKNLTV